MTSYRWVLPCILSLGSVVGTASARPPYSAGSGSWHGAGMVTPAHPPVAIGSGHHHSHGGVILVGAPWVWGWTPYGIVPYVPPIVIIAPGGYFPAGPPIPPRMVAQGLGAMRPAPGTHVAVRQVARGEPQPKPDDPARASQYVTLGDRLFRNGNLKRATDRYEQALHANPGAAAPRVRLAQVALVRGQYTEAANRLREAQAAEPGWLLHAPDIQAIYAEPGDFAAPIARLETHLQVQPGDRDAWLVLGAQWYLSGRTRQAADVFNRLTDRQVDPTLTAFLDATTPAGGH
jgi:hypothetical protein